MAQLVVEDLDPIVIEKLELIAECHGRSLQAELKHILEQVAQTKPVDMTAARNAASQMRQQLA